MRIGNCIVPLDAAVPAMCGGRRVDVVWLDGFYLVGDWLCAESGLCIRVPRLLLALRRLKHGVGVVRARLVY